jgi:hypothetical protein
MAKKDYAAAIEQYTNPVVDCGVDLLRSFS